MIKIKKVRVLSLAKLFGFLLLCFGFIVGFIVTIAYLFFGKNLTQVEGSPESPWVASIAVIVFPLFYGIMGFVLGSILGFSYNFASSLIGGLEIEMK